MGSSQSTGEIVFIKYNIDKSDFAGTVINAKDLPQMDKDELEIYCLFNLKVSLPHWRPTDTILNIFDLERCNIGLKSYVTCASPDIKVKLNIDAARRHVNYLTVIRGNIQEVFYL